MATLSELREERLKKLARYEEVRGSAYPATITRTHTLGVLRAEFSSLEQGTTTVSVVGRVLQKRGQGALLFADISDGTARIQILIKRDVLGVDDHALFTDTVDVGDFVEVSGTCLTTERGEASVVALHWRLISKALRPLPDKWHGLKDTDERYRRRYLETVMDDAVRDRFLLRARILRALRTHLETAGFIEIETPILQHLAGGAHALPFRTHHNALDIDLYLRVAPELYLKKLLIGGFPKVYEMGRAFRNEGIDVTHNPEFTIVEWYEAYSNAEQQRAFVEYLLRELVRETLGTLSLTCGEESIDLAPRFEVVSYHTLLARATGIDDPLGVSLSDIVACAEKHGISGEDLLTREKVLDALYKRLCRPTLINPTFVVHYPIAMLPLAKADVENPEVADAFQLVVGGVELVKAFSELNDPQEQERRFLLEGKHQAAGDREAQANDTDFVEALEYGMPPAGGVGIGVDRLVMLLSNTHNIREVLYFPTLRPKD